MLIVVPCMGYPVPPEIAVTFFLESSKMQLKMCQRRAQPDGEIWNYRGIP